MFGVNPGDDFQLGVEHSRRDGPQVSLLRPGILLKQATRIRTYNNRAKSSTGSLSPSPVICNRDDSCM
jgi:hypothetical protein